MEELEKKAKELRKDIVEMIYYSKSGHPGGSLSCIDILTVLYHHSMNISLDKNGHRIDKFVMSKGHAAPAYYASLASVGLIDKNILNTLRKYDSILEGHPSNKIPGVDSSSGSLGQGLSIANGMGLAKKIDNAEGHVYCLLGDGELEEGQVWEALMSINNFKLNNVIPIIDSNGLQIDGTVENVKNLDKIKEKVESFGLNTIVIDGHNFKHIISAIDKAKNSDIPTCIIAKTIKGKGISFMENKVEWHGKSLSDEEYKIAMSELN